MKALFKQYPHRVPEAVDKVWDVNHRWIWTNSALLLELTPPSTPSPFSLYALINIVEPYFLRPEHVEQNSYLSEESGRALGVCRRSKVQITNHSFCAFNEAHLFVEMIHGFEHSTRVLKEILSMKRRLQRSWNLIRSLKRCGCVCMSVCVSVLVRLYFLLFMLLCLSSICVFASLYILYLNIPPTRSLC